MKYAVPMMAERKCELLKSFRPSGIGREWGTMKGTLHECGLGRAASGMKRLAPGETVELLEGHGHEFALLNKESFRKLGRIMPEFSRNIKKAIPLVLAVEGIKPVSEFTLHPARREIAEILGKGGVLRVQVMGRDMILKKTGNWSVASRDLGTINRFVEIDGAWARGELGLAEKNALLGGLFGYPESAIKAHNGGSGTVLGMLKKSAEQDAEMTSAACNSTFVHSVNEGRVVEQEFLAECDRALSKVLGKELHTLISIIRKIDRMALFSELSAEIHLPR